MVIAESAYLLERELGTDAEAALYTSIIDGDLSVETIGALDWTRIRELVTTYADMGLGGTDASLVASPKGSAPLASPPSTKRTSVSCVRSTATRSNSSSDEPVSAVAAAITDGSRGYRVCRSGSSAVSSATTRS